MENYSSVDLFSCSVFRRIPLNNNPSPNIIPQILPNHINPHVPTHSIHESIKITLKSHILHLISNSIIHPSPILLVAKPLPIYKWKKSQIIL